MRVTSGTKEAGNGEMKAKIMLRAFSAARNISKENGETALKYRRAVSGIMAWR